MDAYDVVYVAFDIDALFITISNIVAVVFLIDGVSVVNVAVVTTTRSTKLLQQNNAVNTSDMLQSNNVDRDDGLQEIRI